MASEIGETFASGRIAAPRSAVAVVELLVTEDAFVMAQISGTGHVFAMMCSEVEQIFAIVCLGTGRTAGAEAKLASERE